MDRVGSLLDERASAHLGSQAAASRCCVTISHELTCLFPSFQRITTQTKTHKNTEVALPNDGVATWWNTHGCQSKTKAQM
mmetsp:Transcript_11500/g.25582  ORF Transcript_11500/g.25582 Transcript_11500/m.25582 type:complete len:80 (-) Transcript_11500:1655-1894(-)